MCIFNFLTGFSQSSVHMIFTKEKDTVRRQQYELYHPVTIKLNSNTIKKDSLKYYTLTIKPNEEKSTIAKSSYVLHFASVALDKINNEYTFFIAIKKDNSYDRDRQLYLNLEFKKELETQLINKADTNQTAIINIQGIRSVNDYNYLGYVGTNFDLVDGVQAKNLFYAINLISTPQIKGDGFGFNLTLYGNRTLTRTDTLGNENYLSKIVGLGGDSARYYYDTAFKTVNRVSDNVGITFSPIFSLGNLSKPEKKTQLFYAPQFEFIWRRTKTTTNYSNVRSGDTSQIRYNRPISGTIMVNQPVSTVVPNNEYDIYLGIAGLMLKHENNLISIRMQGSLGININYFPNPTAKSLRNNSIPSFEKKTRWFCYIRTWITEPTSGITFGAEVSNYFGKKHTNPIYNVTLSKAISLNALGALFTSVAPK